MKTRKSDAPKAFFGALAITAIGAVWLFGGLAIHIFFYYPIILMVAGVVGMLANGVRMLQRPAVPQTHTPYGMPPQQPTYYPPPLPPSVAPPAGVCWHCGQPTGGRQLCATCGAQQYSAPPPMAAYGPAPVYPPAPSYSPNSGYPPNQGYPPAPAYPPNPGYPPNAGYPPSPTQALPPESWGQPPQRSQGW